jgi:hemolysin activation/secretion protein
MRGAVINQAQTGLGPLSGWAIALQLSSVVIAVPALAQQKPPPVDLQQIEKKIDSEESERRHLEQPVPRPPALAPAPSQGSSLPVFQLHSVKIEGAEALAQDQLRPAYEHLLGQKVSQRDLESIAAAITDAYRRSGFHLSRAIIPPQEVSGGHLRVKVVEGSITEIKVEGDEEDRYGISRNLRGLLAERPSTLASVERKLVIANETPGLTVLDTGIEEIGEATGAFRLTLKVKTWRVYGTLGLDNFGSQGTGPLQAYSSTYLNSTFLSGDALAIILSTVPDATRELRAARLTYDTPLGNDGIKIGAGVAHSEVWRNDGRHATETRTINDTYQVRGSVSPLQTRAAALTVFGSLNFTDEDEQDLSKPLYHDRIRFARIGIDVRAEDAFGGSNYATAAIRQGLNAWDATQADDSFSSRTGAPSNFAAFDFTHVRYQKLMGPVSIKTAVNGQLASAPMMSSQLFYLGGAAFGPGYYSGDNGISGLFELRYDQSVQIAWIDSLQFYGFLDGGQTWNRGEKRESLASAGIGMRMRLFKDIYASVAYAVPIAQSSKLDEFSSSRILFSLSTSFKLCPDRGQVFCL